MKPAYNSSYLKIWSKGISPEEKQKVFDYILEHGTVTEKEMILNLQMEKLTVRKIMSGLKEKGFIMKDTEGKTFRSGDPYLWRAIM